MQSSVLLPRENFKTCIYLEVRRGWCTEGAPSATGKWATRASRVFKAFSERLGLPALLIQTAQHKVISVTRCRIHLQLYYDSFTKEICKCLPSSSFGNFKVFAVSANLYIPPKFQYLSCRHP